MLTRRFLRIKVLQALYAYFESGEQVIANGMKELLESIDKLHELFVWQLSFLVETKRFAENKISDKKNKFLPTEEDLNPNMRYVNNRVIAAIENNKDFCRTEAALKINWGDSQDVVKNYYNIMIKSKEYDAYMNAKTDSFGQDKKFIVDMLTSYFSDLEVLQDFYEDKSIYFCDDYYLVLSLLIKFFTEMKKLDVDDKLPSIYKRDGIDPNVDEDFVKNLFRETINHADELGRLVADNTNNWEKERICVMDMLILKMALAELLYFPFVPVKVTMNEYIEISKYFSTPKSKVFVNGIIDRIYKKLSEDGKIIKRGIGLLGN